MAPRRAVALGWVDGRLMPKVIGARLMVPSARRRRPREMTGHYPCRSRTGDGRRRDGVSGELVKPLPCMTSEETSQPTGATNDVCAESSCQIRLQEDL